MEIWAVLWISDSHTQVACPGVGPLLGWATRSRRHTTSNTLPPTDSQTPLRQCRMGAISCSSTSFFLHWTREISGSAAGQQTVVVGLGTYRLQSCQSSVFYCKVQQSCCCKELAASAWSRICTAVWLKWLLLRRLFHQPLRFGCRPECPGSASALGGCRRRPPMGPEREDAILGGEQQRLEFARHVTFDMTCRARILLRPGPPDPQVIFNSLMSSCERSGRWKTAFDVFRTLYKAHDRLSNTHDHAAFEAVTMSLSLLKALLQPSPASFSCWSRWPAAAQAGAKMNYL